MLRISCCHQSNIASVVLSCLALLCCFGSTDPAAHLVHPCRLDDVVVFDPLSSHQLLGVARLMAHELNDRLAPKNITLQATDAALHFAVSQAYEPAYGARPLRRWLEHTIITDLSRMIVAGQLPDNSIVTVDYDAVNQKLGYSVELKPLPADVAADGGVGVMSALKRQLGAPYGSAALDDDEEEDEEMET